MRSAEMTTPRGPYRTGIRRRQEIISAASRIFARYGYSTGSLRMIADEVGVVPGALARHFDKKGGLLAAVLADWDERVTRRFPVDSEGLDFFRDLRNTIIFNRENRGLIELFLTLAAESTNENHPAHVLIRERYDRIVTSALSHLRTASEHGETIPMTEEQMHHEVRALFATMDGIQLQWLVDPTVDSIAIFTHTLDTTLRRWAAGRDG
jgi:AcrR family transcriptional regulator